MNRDGPPGYVSLFRGRFLKLGDGVDESCSVASTAVPGMEAHHPRRVAGPDSVASTPLVAARRMGS